VDFICCATPKTIIICIPAVSRWKFGTQTSFDILRLCKWPVFVFRHKIQLNRPQFTGLVLQNLEGSDLLKENNAEENSPLIEICRKFKISR
jgi:hypothetical protein